MTLASSPGGSPRRAGFPRSLSSFAYIVGGLALFLILASCLLLSNPIGITVSEYFYSVDRKVDFPVSPVLQTPIDVDTKNNVDVIVKNSSSGSYLESPKSSVSPSVDSNISSPVQKSNSLGASSPVDLSPSASNVTENAEINSVSPVLIANSAVTPSGDFKEGSVPATSPVASNSTTISSGCDLYHGSWFYDASGPLYTNNTCPVLTQMQNCQGNGRPDKDYEYWRWRPFQCDLPRFDAKKFLELMRGKTLAFIGDSVARNQMESMLCLLWQVEAPRNRGNRKMQRWHFKSTNTMIVRIWSSWLVHRTSEPFDYAPAGVDKLHLDAPDEHFMEFIPKFDVVVLSSGHWFAKQSVYILNNEIVGGQLWWPDKSKPMKINNVDAFGVSVETILTAMAMHPNYKGLTIVRSYSPDHYEGGAWNTGGSCTGKERPLGLGELVENGFTKIMHEKQVMGFNAAVKKAANNSKLRLMDITEAFSYRHDGHPGPYRSPDPNKKTKRGPDGRPPPQDCLHWCMPGPVDTWNEIVLELIRREFEGNQSSIS